MYLKSLTLRGFKSFADRTHMLFDKGLTVVVGPNGSGKSNVSDAILWVLGEQSAKMLRGQAMEDVIFSGSSSRNAVGVAEVTLVLDNSDGLVALEFDEVAITRRMYRSGESEYLINNSVVRLMDIQDILHDSGLGKETHSIISQGKLDHILSSKPEQRRVLIEEAAGISKHQRRKERSERKLKSMEEKLVRAKDIARVLSRQIKPLERQVDKAKRAEELTQKLARAQVMFKVEQLRDLQSEWNKLKDTANQRHAELEFARFNLEEKTKELHKLQVILEEKGLFVGDLSEHRRTLQNLVGRIDSDMRLLEEKGKNMVEKLSEMRMSLSQISNQKKHAQKELDDITFEIIKAQEQLKIQAETLSVLNPQYQKAQQTARELKNNSVDLTNRFKVAKKTADSEKLTFVRLQETISSATSEESMIQTQLQRIAESLEQAKQASIHAQSEQEAIQSVVNELSREADMLNAQLAQLRAEDKTIASQLDDAIKERNVCSAQLQSLEAYEQNDPSFSSAQKTLLKEVSEKSGFLGKLSDCIQVPEQYEGLVESLLGQDLFAPIINEAKTARDVLQNYLNSNKNSNNSRVSAITSLSSVNKPQRIDGLVCLADTIKTFDQAIYTIVEALFANIFVVDSLEQGLSFLEQYSGVHFVSKQGFHIYPDGRIVVLGNKTPGQGALERKKKISNLKDKIPGLEQICEDFSNKQIELSHTIKAVQEKLISLRQDLAHKQGLYKARMQESGRLTKDIEAFQKEKKLVEDRFDAFKIRVQSAKEKLQIHQNLSDEAQKKADQLQEALSDLSEQVTQAQEQEQIVSHELSQVKLNHATLQERVRHLEAQKHQLQVTLEQANAKHATILQSTHALEVLRLRVDPLHETYEQIQTCAWGWARRLKDQASLAQADSDSLKKTINEARAQVAKAHREIDDITSVINADKVSAGRLEVQVQTLIDEIIQTKQYTLEEALELPIPEDVHALKAEIADLELKISQIGPVNQVAMEEYQNLKERFDYINAQVTDMEEAKKTLRKITLAIERKMKKQFLKTFDTINENFKAVFSMLFPGGKAHLELLQPDSPFESGVEIIAQPKGKKVSKMMLLSGGEKSLTALALLFAVYQTRTVPFYVFDEVEAALDASNLDKLLNAIEILKKQTQLIVISHQRKTMEQADVLYGVSMQSDGVSKVVSQKLQIH